MVCKHRHHHHHPFLLSLLIIFSSLPYLASGFYGNQQAKIQNKFQKLRYMRGQNDDDNISGIDKSPFEAEDIDIKAHIYDQDGLKGKDLIDKLPGQPLVRFDQYGGYVTVDQKAGRAFYYYFTEAYENKQKLPLVLWLNGGPGCSSLAYGAMQELGPFRVNSDGKTLFKNRYAWNYVANVLFLESPVGVGFSYSNTSSDIFDINGDKRTALDNYIFLLNWLERFPEYKDRDFYVTGESYAGHYVPQLAQTILQNNIKANKTIINLKGILIGNPTINDETDDKGMYDFLASHAILSESLASIINKCNSNDTTGDLTTDKCYEAMDECYRDVRYIDIYHIYAPLCKNTSLTATPKPATLVLDECNEHYVIAYMNRGDVQEALHANVTKLEIPWRPCNWLTWHDRASSTLPILRQLMDHGIRVWIFSGDVDGIVPVTATLYSLNTMNMQVNASWHPWHFNGELAGYTQVYKGDLTYATVRDAGHQVPSYQAARSLALFKHFLDGTSLPDTTKY